MVKEILNYTQDIPHLRWCLDATFGRGGHTQALKKRWPSLKILALDQDLEAVEWGKKHIQSSDIHIQNLNFHYFEEELLKRYSIGTGFDIILLDLGPSSPQLDRPERGFSFYKEGPLDMRMNPYLKKTAADIVNNDSEEELTHLFREYGEIYNSRSVVNSIIRERKKNKILSTLQFAKLVEKSTSWRGRRNHPATNYFLALRIAVNNELDGLQQSLPHIVSLLNPHGRMFVISFHSLEDRIVKRFFKKCVEENQGVLINKKVIRPSSEERTLNPRSRSAKLRIFQKGEVA